MQDILGAVNAPHHCQNNECGLTGHRIVRQEREDTEHRAPVLEHRHNPHVRVLNIGQMHNSRVLEAYRVPSTPISADDETQILALSAVNEHASQAKAAKVSGPRAFSRPTTPTQSLSSSEMPPPSNAQIVPRPRRPASSVGHRPATSSGLRSEMDLGF